MAFLSTRDASASFSFAEALRLGPAPDGGLFMPASLAPLDAGFWQRLPGLGVAQIAREVLLRLLDSELDGDALEALAEDALDFEMPVVEVTDRLRVLELFRGPTLAFKDVGARFLARFLALTRPEGGRSTVLVATSGDTGGAVAQAFYGVEGVRVAILYPRGKVSLRQERQFTTLGGNVRAFAIEGAFDDCQSLVKEAFADRDLARRVALTSANSINIGRLLPQAIYYVHAAAQIPARRPLLFATPSGNFGNLTAGLLARRLGLEARFLAATNSNDAVPSYLESGRYRPRASLRTISNAMDVGSPNNFERIQHLYGEDLEALRRDVSGTRVDDDETRETLGRVWRRHGYLLDPHTAVGWRALEQALEREPRETAGVVLATAHPAKFAEVVEPEIGREVEVPERLARPMSRPVRSEPLPRRLDALRDRLLSW
ncbi:MAG: threonine synthase [Acidobacteriota bacterium]